MIKINSKLVYINNKTSWIQYLPTSVKPANLRGWFKLDGLQNVELNFQNQSGTVSSTIGSNTVSGIGTVFSALDLGKRIKIGSSEKWITNILSGTAITVDSPFIEENTNQSFSYGYISKWINSVTGMPDFVQTSISSQPLIRLVNNKINVHFNSVRSTELLTTLPSVNLGSKQTMFFRCNNLKTSGFSDIFNSVINSEEPRVSHTVITNAVSYYCLANSYANYWSSDGNIVKDMTLCLLNNGNGLSIINQNNINVSVSSNTGSPVVNKIINDRFCIGNYQVEPSASYAFRGYYSEFIIYDDVLETQERGKITDYLNLKSY